MTAPLADKDEANKVRMLLLWSDDKGPEIYNTATWANDGDDLLLLPVWEKLEAYVRPRSNRILARFQLRSIKQGEMKLEEFITRARTLIDDSGYPAANREEMLRDTLVFGIKSDKVRRDAIAIGNDMTYQQVYDLAKTEESTAVQMDIIAGSDSSPQVHAVRSRRGPQSYRSFNQKKNEDGKKQFHPQKKKASHKPCHKCGDEHTRGSCPAKYAKCYFCKKIGHYTKVCRKKLRKVNEMTQDNSSEDMNRHNHHKDEDC